MSEIPEISWLKRRWNLPEDMAPAVTQLLDAECKGHTAIMLSGENDVDGEAFTSEFSPLVVVNSDHNSYLQTRKLHQAEFLIASKLLSLAKITYPSVSEDLLDQLFPGSSDGDLQKEAVNKACSRALTIISGGPGTGKTYTLARVLALLVKSGMDPHGIRLAAPTGKAADRMKIAVADSLEGLPKEFSAQKDALKRIAESARTLHSLLRYNPSKEACDHHLGNPLPCSLLIVDECSMVDVMLWKTLLEALPNNARLILLGDPDQLESIGQGNILEELTQYATAKNSPLSHNHVQLKEARRFGESPGILAFSEALKNSDPIKAVALLKTSAQDSGLKGLTWIEFSGGALPVAKLPTPILESLERVARAPTPVLALQALSDVCILTAQREHFVGSKATSKQIDAFVSNLADIKNHPIIINRNDPETGLKNGLVGVIHTENDGRRSAWFTMGDERLRKFPLSKLPDYSPAWAITIHRSQGSEYDNVLVVVPQAESEMANRSLLYTAITRAKKSVYVMGDLASVQKAAATSSKRTTLLQVALYHLHDDILPLGH